MALTYSTMLVIKKIIETEHPQKALSYGYPDILIDLSELKRLFPDCSLTPREDSAEIVRWHSGKLKEVAETVEFFSSLGVELDIVDVHASRGFEKELDLNVPLPDDFKGKYDLVMDLGTSEHCFNIGQAIMNAAECVQKGGVVLHSTPLSMMNHGFYNINPTAYYDFYSQNGFSVLTINVTDGKQLGEVPITQRFTASDNLSLIAAVKKESEQPLKWPMQYKYLVNSELKG